MIKLSEHDWNWCYADFLSTKEKRSRDYEIYLLNKIKENNLPYDLFKIKAVSLGYIRENLVEVEKNKFLKKDWVTKKYNVVTIPIEETVSLLEYENILTDLKNIGVEC